MPYIRREELLKAAKDIPFAYSKKVFLYEDGCLDVSNCDCIGNDHEIAHITINGNDYEEFEVEEANAMIAEDILRKFTEIEVIKNQRIGYR